MLRYTVLSYIAEVVFLYGQFWEQFHLYIDTAFCLLQIKLTHFDTLNINDFCILYILTYVEPWSSKQMYLHFNRCLIMYNHLFIKNL